MGYQRFRYKGQVYQVPVWHIDGESFVFLEEVQDRIHHSIRSFTCNKIPLSFERDRQGLLLTPERIRVFSEEVIDCKKLNDYNKLAGKIDHDLDQVILRIDDMTQQILENMEILQEKADTILRQIFQLAEFTVPRLFIILPEETAVYNPINWFHSNYRLYFLCECENENEYHLAFHEGYKIRQPREFLCTYGPHLRKMFIFVKCALALGSLVVPGIPASTVLRNRFMWENFSRRIEQMSEILKKAEQSVNIAADRAIQHLEGPELRKIQYFLKKVDDRRTLGNLFRSTTSDGHVRWVCVQHYQKHYGNEVMQGLQRNFRELGGEIIRDSVVIEGNASKNLSKMFNVLRQGLPVFSVTLKDLKLEEKMFDNLLEFVAQTSIIRNLELDNVTVSPSFGRERKYREIIPKLEDALQRNTTLTVQYKFQIPLVKFSRRLRDVITHISSRLLFQVRSLELTQFLEITKTDDSELVLSAVNSEGKNTTSYITGLQNMCSMVNTITKIHFRGAPFSRETWTCLHNVVSMSRVLRELTFHCQLTLKQTSELCDVLRDNNTLTKLHFVKAWQIEDEIDGWTKVFVMLGRNSALLEFALTGHTEQFQLEFFASCLLQNKSLQILRLPKCRISVNTDVELIEKFLRKTFIHTLSLELINNDREAILERFAHAIDRNESLETLELKGSQCSAIFHRRVRLPENSNSNLVRSPAVRASARPSRSTLKRFFSLLSCSDAQHRQSRDRSSSLPPSRAPTSHARSVSSEPFYLLCDHPPLYKQIQEIAQNLKLEELQVTTIAGIEIENIAMSMTSNSTVTGLRISQRTLKENDVRVLAEALKTDQRLRELQIAKQVFDYTGSSFKSNNFVTLVEALSNNPTLTHLNLSGTRISLDHFTQIFDVLRNNTTLRVLDVRGCILNSERTRFTQQMKQFVFANPFLEILHENE